MKITVAYKEVKEIEINDYEFKQYAIDNGYDVSNDEDVLECLDGYLCSTDPEDGVTIDYTIEEIVVNSYR